MTISAFWTTDRAVATAETARGSTPRNPTAAPATGAAAREADAPGTTARDAETAEVPLVAIQAGAAAGAAATASPTAEVAAGAAIAGPVIAAGPHPHLGTRALPHGRANLGRPAARAFGKGRGEGGDEVGAQQAERNSTSDRKRWTSLPRSWPQARRKISCGIVSMQLRVGFPVLGRLS